MVQESAGWLLVGVLFLFFFLSYHGEVKTDLHSLFPLFSHGQRSLKLSVPVFVKGNTVNRIGLLGPFRV